MISPSESEAIVQELMILLGTDRQIAPYSKRFPNFDLLDAYRIAARVRDRRAAAGANSVGRKIGFTNKSIWGDFGISAPIWNYVYDQTVEDFLASGNSLVLRGMPEARIEPEIVLHLASAPDPGMTSAELAECVDWAAPGFEIVYSVFPNWRFTAADAAAAYGVHGRLFVGERRQLTFDRAMQLSSFSVVLESADIRREGQSKNVLGGPLEALRFLVQELARLPGCEPLGPGEIITTGTLTEAMPIRPAETWTASFQGVGFSSLRLSID